MFRLTVAVLAVALAGTASAGWRSLRIDASSEATFTESAAAIRQELPAARRHLFDWALRDIWEQGAQRAEAEQREYTAEEYFRELDGLSYKKIVTFTDPTGDTADARLALVRSRLHPRTYVGSLNSFERLYTPMSTTEKTYPTTQEHDRLSRGITGLE